MTLKNSMGLVLFECPVCHSISKSRKSMATHIKRLHKGIKMRDCKRINTKNYEYLETKVEDDA
jgi:uncharacterized C2H2 Zn-finger protein